MVFPIQLGMRIDSTIHSPLQFPKLYDARTEFVRALRYNMRLQDKVAVITGGANGMGRATALRFAQEGARVLVADVEIENAETVAAEIRSDKGAAVAVQVDVRSGASVDAMIARAVQEFGRLDILCSIAG